MFGFGKKARAAEAIRRGVQATLTGAYFHNTEVEKFGLNKSASSWLYTEALAHQLYALGYISSTALAGMGDWVTLDFFFESAIDGIKESEKNGGPSTDQLAPVLFKRYIDFEAFTGEERVAGAHYKNSADFIFAQDTSADIEKIATALQNSVDKYVRDARKMFDL